MPHNSSIHRDSMRRLHVYVASALFLKTIGWTQAQMGHIAIDKSTGSPLVAIVVGKVNEYRINCEPLGNYNAKFNNFEKAKFTFSLDCPNEPGYAEDWEKTIATLEKFQTLISFTKERKNLIEPATRSIKFGAPIFEKRDIPIKRPQAFPGSNQVYLEDVEPKFADGTDPIGSDTEGTAEEFPSEQQNEDHTVDFDTEHWPVPIDLQDKFNNIKYTHKINPLPVYDNDLYVEPALVNNTLKSSLIEVHFNIRHHKIGDHDSFTGVPVQVIVLKSPTVPSSSPYKRKNLRDGPIRPKPFDGPAKENAVSASNIPTSPTIVVSPLDPYPNASIVPPAGQIASTSNLQASTVPSTNKNTLTNKGKIRVPPSESSPPLSSPSTFKNK